MDSSDRRSSFLSEFDRLKHQLTGALPHARGRGEPTFDAEARERYSEIVHVRELGMQAASDEEIFDRAAQDDPVVVSADTDFGTLLAIRKQTAPSMILFRHGSQHRPADQAEPLKTNLPQLVGALDAGSIVVIQPDRIRVRALPMIP